jgi:hypothetical protein
MLDETNQGVIFQFRMNLFISRLKESVRTLIAFVRSDLFLCYFGALPLFFSWLPNLTWRYENNRLRNISLYSCMNTVFFFSFLFLANLFFWFPWIGEYLANLIHFLGILSYLGVSSFLVYLVATEKNIEIPILSILFHHLVEFLEEK